MGILRYGSPPLEVTLDDRVLAHLQFVITTKLRRKESFVFSWRDDPDVSEGRSSIWIEPSIPLHFKYTDPEVPVMNRAWIDVLMRSAYSADGLKVVEEPRAEKG
ncbi:MULTISPECIES: hypothetical protein [unclassified Salinibacterium]|uniref:DUF7882 family protein n=1 Tax=unclassified Salinibacterium TaxID=2632331 RepID=UPI001421F301|nr:MULTISPECIES: hypothetical protein [unclassified Salinibacterium]